MRDILYDYTTKRKIQYYRQNLLFVVIKLIFSLIILHQLKIYYFFFIFFLLFVNVFCQLKLLTLNHRRGKKMRRLIKKNLGNKISNQQLLSILLMMNKIIKSMIDSSYYLLLMIQFSLSNYNREHFISFHFFAVLLGCLNYNY